MEHALSNPALSLPADCSLVLSTRVAGAALLGLAVVAVEAWLRVPVRPLFDGYLQQAQARVATFVHKFSS